MTPIKYPTETNVRLAYEVALKKRGYSATEITKLRSQVDVGKIGLLVREADTIGLRGIFEPTEFVRIVVYVRGLLDISKSPFPRQGRWFAAFLLLIYFIERVGYRVKADVNKINGWLDQIHAASDEAAIHNAAALIRDRGDIEAKNGRTK